MSDGGGKRRRRSVEDAKREILETAERVLRESGPDAVRVQVVARELGISDAAVHYHFGSRDALMEALLRDVGRRMKRELQLVIDSWDPDQFDVRSLVSLLDDSYRQRGYGRLAAWMQLTGWRSKGSGMFRSHAEAIHAARLDRARQLHATPPPMEDSLHLVVLLNLVTWADAVVGGEWRRSVGLPATADGAAEFRDWFASLLEQHLGGDLV